MLILLEKTFALATLKIKEREKTALMRDRQKNFLRYDFCV